MVGVFRQVSVGCTSIKKLWIYCLAQLPKGKVNRASLGSTRAQLQLQIYETARLPAFQPSFTDKFYMNIRILSKFSKLCNTS